METHVLVPIDGSDPSWKAFEYALSDIRATKITALHAFDPIDGLFADADEGGLFAPDDGGLFDVTVRDRIDEVNEELTAEARRRFDDASVRGAETLEIAIEPGQPARTIVDYAEAHGVSHIVVGSHGREGVSRVLLGSVAEKVARRAPVPVTIVR